jgi:hypothetical protein
MRAKFDEQKIPSKNLLHEIKLQMSSSLAGPEQIFASKSSPINFKVILFRKFYKINLYHIIGIKYFIRI